MDKGIWKETVRENANEEAIGSHDRCKGGVFAMKRKGVPFVERGKRGGERVCERTIEKRIYPATQVTTNSTSVFCREEGWEEEDGARLSLSK